MPADYKSRGTGREKKGLPGFAWFLAGLGIGLFVALIFYLDARPKNETDFGTAVQKELEKLKQRPAKEKSKATKDNKQEPKFNFYTILPELEVLIPDSETRPPKKDSSTPVNGDISPGKQYILQAGSFQNKEDAEKLKATLALIGYQANIQRVSINREAWHRVRLGPYSSTSELYKTISALQQHDISTMPMELK